MKQNRIKNLIKKNKKVLTKKEFSFKGLSEIKESPEQSCGQAGKGGKTSLDIVSIFNGFRF